LQLPRIATLDACSPYSFLFLIVGVCCVPRFLLWRFGSRQLPQRGEGPGGSGPYLTPWGHVSARASGPPFVSPSILSGRARTTFCATPQPPLSHASRDSHHSFGSTLPFPAGRLHTSLQSRPRSGPNQTLRFGSRTLQFGSTGPSPGRGLPPTSTINLASRLTRVFPTPPTCLASADPSNLRPLLGTAGVQLRRRKFYRETF
jgi:hypothetical protein